MTLEEINQVLNCVELAHPVELEDIAAIRSALGDDVEVFHRVREVIVQVHRDGKQVYQRILPVKDAPPFKKSPKYP